MIDVGIINGLVYINQEFHKLNVYISGEKIVALTQDVLAAKKVIDVRGKYVLPGFIDPHVHFALGVGTNISKDDFQAGAIEAVYGGVTTYIDFLDPIHKTSEIKDAFKTRQALAEKSIADYAFHLTVANPTSPAKEIIETAKAYGINSVKLFTTYSETDRRTFDGTIYELLQESGKQKAIILIHAENDELINKAKDILVKDHEKARPTLAENIEVVKLAQMARKTGGNLYIVHVSAGSTVALLRKVFQKELKNHQIILESCPHYFLLNSTCLDWKDGYKYTMTPPLREEEERKLLSCYIDEITTIGTDHCPYTKRQKAHAYTSEIPMGIGGIRYAFLNMYNAYGFKVIDKFTRGPAKVYGLQQKGALLPGFDGDIVIFDAAGETFVNDAMSVYDKKHLKGCIETVFIRGSVVLEKGSLKTHQGMYIRRGGGK